MSRPHMTVSRTVTQHDQLHAAVTVTVTWGRSTITVNRDRPSTGWEQHLVDWMIYQPTLDRPGLTGPYSDPRSGIPVRGDAGLIDLVSKIQWRRNVR